MGAVLHVVFVTAPADHAERLARGLVEAGLAACVQRSTVVRSTYVWDGVVHEDDEVQLVIKTATAAAARDWIVAHHPYEVPQVVAVAVDEAASVTAYVSWVRASCKEPS